VSSFNALEEALERPVQTPDRGPLAVKDQRPYRSGSSALIFFNCASWLLNVTWWRPIRHASRRSSSAAL